MVIREELNTILVRALEEDRGKDEGNYLTTALYMIVMFFNRNMGRDSRFRSLKYAVNPLYPILL